MEKTKGKRKKGKGKEEKKKKSRRLVKGNKTKYIKQKK